MPRTFDEVSQIEPVSLNERRTAAVVMQEGLFIHYTCLSGVSSLTQSSVVLCILFMLAICLV